MKKNIILFTGLAMALSFFGFYSIGKKLYYLGYNNGCTDSITVVTLGFGRTESERIKDFCKILVEGETYKVE